MPIMIDRLSLEDAADAAEIEQETFGSQGWKEQDIIDTLKLDYAYYLAARVSERLIGLAGARLIAGEAYISNVSVRPEFRHKGIGTLLMMKLMGLLKEVGAEAYTLEVRRKNTAAIGMYEKLGFVDEGIRPGFYEEPADDAVIMWKR